MKTTYRFVIDANEANVPERVGSNTYAFHLLEQLEHLTRRRRDIEWTVLLSQPPVSDMPKSRPRFRYEVVGPQWFWTQFAEPVYLWKNSQKHDVLFTPGHYAPKHSAIPYVSSVMDVAYLHFPKQFKLKDQTQLQIWTKHSVEHAAGVVTISDSTRRDVLNHYKVRPENVVVAYPAVETNPHRSSAADRQLRKMAVTQPFILHIGTLQPRKNIERLIAAFELLKQGSGTAISELQLVLAGKIGWLSQPIIERINSSPYKSSIRQLQYVTAAQKEVLLANAEILVSPGLYEGFGIPVLEAMAHGTLIVASQTSSLPEVVGDAGFLVNPESPESIAEGIWQALTLSKKDTAIFRRKMKQQLKKFSWEESARIVLELLMKVADAHTRN
jgi:glycosyltransferase involved in cell wall biosynthesis